jgi:hypothetical protein
VFDDAQIETVAYANSYAQAKEYAFKYVLEMELANA